jgi:hypothetical protein
MSVTGISNSLYQSGSGQNNVQNIQTEFQQLGQDLQSGNLSGAQQDYATLSANLTDSQQQNSTSAGNPAAQAFSQLGQALQSGNLSGAQQAFATLQQDVQQGTQQAGGAHHHHRHHGGGSGANSSSSQSSDTISQDLSALGQALQSNNLSGAQQAFATLTSDIQAKFGSASNSGTGNGSSTSVSSGTSQASANTLDVSA